MNTDTEGPRRGHISSSKKQNRFWVWSETFRYLLNLSLGRMSPVFVLTKNVGLCQNASRKTLEIIQEILDVH